MMFRKYILSVAFILSTICTYAQFRISGKIADMSSKELLIGASVSLPDLKTGTISDAQGNYQVSNLKKGSYLVVFSYSGYKSYYAKLDLKKDTTLNVSLEPSATELGEVVVTGVTRSTELKHNPIVVATIDKNNFVQNSATNLIDALKNVPGVAQLTTGPNISKPIIRGLGYNRIITLNNGIKHEGQQWGDEHGIELDEYSIDRVEIIKGPGSLMFGSDGIGGVLNFLSAKPTLNHEIKTQILTNYQSNNNLVGYSVANAGNIDGYHWAARLTNKYAGNYSNPYDGKVFNSGFKEFDGRMALGMTKKWGYTNISVNSYNTKLGLVEGERDSQGKFTYENEEGEDVAATAQQLSGYNIYLPYQKINHLGIISNSYLILDKGTINADFGFQNNRRREFEDIETPDEPGLYFSLNTINYNIRYNLEKANGWETSFGIGGMQQTNANLGEEFLIPAYRLFDVGVFGYTQKTMNKLTIAGGVRFDNRNINTSELYLDEDGIPVESPDNNSVLKFSHFSHNYNGVSGSVGISYQTDKYSTLKFNFSNGFRAPNIAELSSNGNHEGTFRYEIGNPNLKSELSHQLDLAYYINSPHINFQISPFVNYISNYIFVEKMKDADGNDVFPDPSFNVPGYRYTSGNATLVGGEVYFDFHPHPVDWLHIENAFSLVSGYQSKQSDSTKYLPFIPAPHYRGGLKAEFTQLNTVVSNLYVKFNVDYYFAQNNVYSAYGTETQTPGYALLSAGIGVGLKAFNRKDFLNINLTAENLADKAYQNHLSRLKYAPENELNGRTGVFNMSRNFSVKLIINF